jgi:hypothetical protein
MRAIFGIAGLLIVIGVIVWWMGAPGGELDQDRAVIQAGNKAREQVDQISGHDSATGGKAMDTAVFEMRTSNGRPASLNVASVVPGGAYERYFGLKKEDLITGVQYQGFTKTVKEMDSAEDGREQVGEAFQRRGTITVKRDGRDLTLPLPPGTPAAPAPSVPAAAAPASPDSAATPSAAAPAAPSSTPPQPRQTPLERQLNQIQEGAGRQQ